MKTLLKITAVVLGLLILIYYGYFFVMPSVTVINNSEFTIENARVELPNSGLDFGRLQPADTNSIYYDLEQSNGSYQYQMTLSDGSRISGTCGEVTSHEIHKRMIINFNQDKVTCE